ncbi:MAG: rhamnogalacturonan lyase [Oscillospiraceae bacterium]|nr:rhamnogalacturonan lyase [Oscillospiraceae bacterium]
MMNRKQLIAFSTAVLLCAGSAMPTTAAHAAYGVGGNGTAIMEHLDRGIYAVKSGNGMFVSWRWNADDDDNAEFQLYRDNQLIYTSKSGDATSYQDNGGNANSKYRVDTVVNGTVVGSEECRFHSGTNYFDIPLNSPGSNYSPNDCCVGDVDGDGQYEIFLKWDPNDSQDNSKSGNTSNVYIDCVTLDGRTLWRVDLGKNIRAGQHYTQMCVADFDCDGHAELITKTADGTKDGTGKVIGDGSKNHRNGSGYILDGPEYMTLFDGQTGAALDTINFPVPRGKVSDWGDNYGNRVDRFNSGIAYLDGVHPSAIYNRGYYTRMTISAVDVVDKKLSVRWIFDSNNNGSGAAYSQGNHNLMVADVDDDGRQEICMGSSMIDDDGKLLWATGAGHGDAMHLGDLDPDRPGLEVWMCHEHTPFGVSLVDAKTGKVIFRINGDKDTGRCCGDNVWSGSKGAELWGARPAKAVLDKTGKTIASLSPSMNFLIYWDGDLEREMLSDTMISKMKSATQIDYFFTAEGCASNNSTKAVPCLTADLFGDWREELIMRTTDNKKLRVWCTTYTTKTRLTTLMHDMQYRAQDCCQQSAYNQPPHVSYYLGSDAPLPARPNVIVNGESTYTPPEPIKYADGSFITNLTVSDTVNAANWSVVTETKQVGSTVFGDRAFTFTAMPKVLDGAEWIQTACDSKKFAGDEASFTAGADITAYVALDTRITDVPAWLGDWTKTADPLTDDGNPVVTYQLYKKDFSAGETVKLGALAQSSCVNYAVAVTAQKADVLGDINQDGICDQTDLVMMRDYLLTVGELTPEQGAIADMSKDGKINAIDLTLLKRLLL